MPARWGAGKAGLLGLAGFAMLGGGWPACRAQNPLDPLAPLAVGRAKRGNAPPACEGGYRRAGLLRDFALGRGWTIYADCAHPERPLVAVASEAERPMAPAGRAAARERAAVPNIASPEDPIPEAARGGPGASAVLRAMPAAAAGAARPAVGSGSPVRVWRRDGVAAVDLAGIALETGVAGARIRVRVSPGGSVVRGTVRAAGSVELDAPGSGGFGGEGK